MPTPRRTRRLLIGGAITASALFFAAVTAFAVFGLQAIGDDGGGIDTFDLDRPELAVGLAPGDRDDHERARATRLGPMAHPQR